MHAALSAPLALLPAPCPRVAPQGEVEAPRVLLTLYEQTWNDELRSHDLMLVQALTANPGDVRPCRLMADAAEREGELLVEPVSRLAMAEFAHMEECQRMDQPFRKLEEALRDRK